MDECTQSRVLERLIVTSQAGLWTLNSHAGCLFLFHRCVQSGGAAFLLGLPTLTCLGYDVYQRLQRAAVVLAVEKGNPVFYTIIYTLLVYHFLTQISQLKHFKLPSQSLEFTFKMHLPVQMRFWSRLTTFTAVQKQRSCTSCCCSTRTGEDELNLFVLCSLSYLWPRGRLL